MAIRRLNGRATLLRRVDDLEVLVAARAPERTQEQWWLDFHNAAPAPVWQYVLDIGAEQVADTTFDPADSDRWWQSHHPLFEDMVEGLYIAFHQHRERLPYVQGWLLKNAWWHLGWAYARQRQPQTGGVHYNPLVEDQAAHELLDWTRAEAQQGWLEPERFLERWRFLGNVPRNPDVLEHAALFGAELKLLESEDD